MSKVDLHTRAAVRVLYLTTQLVRSWRGPCAPQNLRGRRQSEYGAMNSIYYSNTVVVSCARARGR